MPLPNGLLPAPPAPAHDCGLCDEPIVFDGFSGPHTTWRCGHPECDWWHISIDCCDPSIPVIIRRRPPEEADTYLVHTASEQLRSGVSPEIVLLMLEFHVAVRP